MNDVSTEASKGWLYRTPLQAAAVAVTASRFASAPYLARELHIELADAQQLLDQLQERGVVGPPQQAGARMVLISDPSRLPAELQGGAK